MNTVIIDNEVNSINNLKSILENYDNITIKKTFSDSVDALSYLLKNPCDAIFLDIDMPNINGIYLAEQITYLYPETKICFITAYNSFAVKAFELNAIDYILKPFNEMRIANSIKKMNKYKTDKLIIDELSSTYKYELDIICGFDDETVVLINFNEIFYIEIINRKILIHTQNKIYSGNKPLKFYEDKLKKRSFFRSHKCYLVNLEKIDNFKPRITYTYDMYFKEIDDIIPLSRNKVKELKLLFDV